MASAPRRRVRLNIPGLVTMGVLVMLWELVVRTHTVDFEYLPAPSGVGRALGSLAASGKLLDVTSHTLRATLIGWLLAAAAGIALGTWLGLSRTAWRYSMASIEVMRAIPPISLVPLALLVFGFSLRTELVLVVYVGTWTVLVNTIDGVRNVTPELLDVARILRMSRIQRVRTIVLPSATPSIVVGLRLALSLALVLAVVAEMIGNPHGLGNALVRAQQALQPEQMFAYVVTIGLLGVGLNGVLGWVSGRLLPAVTDRAADTR